MKGGIYTNSFQASSTPVVPNMHKEYINSYVKEVSFVEQKYKYTYRKNIYTLLIFKYMKLFNVINKIQLNSKNISEFIVTFCHDTFFLNAWILKS